MDWKGFKSRPARTSDRNEEQLFISIAFRAPMGANYGDPGKMNNQRNLNCFCCADMNSAEISFEPEAGLAQPFRGRSFDRGSRARVHLSFINCPSFPCMNGWVISSPWALVPVMRLFSPRAIAGVGDCHFQE